MYELHHMLLSTCSQKVRLCLAEKNLTYKSRIINLFERENLTPEYLAINPNGVVPTLVHNGRSVLDSSVICEYLDEVEPKITLSPSNPLGRAQMRAWMRFFEEVPTAAIRIPSFNKVFVKTFSSLSREAFESDIAQRPLRKHFFGKMGQAGFSEREYNESLERLMLTLRRMEEALQQSTWLLGAQFTLADIVVAPSIVRMDDLGMSEMFEPFPHVIEWYEHLKARPSFAIAYEEGARLSVLA